MCWKEYFYELLNPVTVQYLETSKEQIGKEIYLTEAEISKAIKLLKPGKASCEDDIQSEIFILSLYLSS